MDIQNTIQALREELNQHNYNYYVLDTPTISDFEFDQKLKELREGFGEGVAQNMQNLVGSHDATRIGSAVANPDGKKLSYSYFRPPASASECKPFQKDEWKDGKKTGNKITVTAEEVFKMRNQEYIYFLIQLAIALLESDWKTVFDKFKDHCTSYEAVTAIFIKLCATKITKNKVN